MTFNNLIIKLLFLLIIHLSALASEADKNSQLFPPASLGEFNATGPLNSFVEQLQANSRSQEQMPPPPVIQMPAIPQGLGSIIYYGSNPVQAQAVPPEIGPQNRPALDPALQQLLNSFNTNPDQQNRNNFIQHPLMAADTNTPVISYITCYVGCSHVTNVVTSDASRPDSSYWWFGLLLLFYYLH